MNKYMNKWGGYAGVWPIWETRAHAYGSDRKHVNECMSVMRNTCTITVMEDTLLHIITVINITYTDVRI